MMKRIGTSVVRGILLAYLLAAAGCAAGELDAAAGMGGDGDPAEEAHAPRADGSPDLPLSLATPLPREWTVVPCRRSNETRRRIPRSGGTVDRGVDVVRIEVPAGAWSATGVQEVTFQVIEARSEAEATIRTVPANVRFERPLVITMSYARCEGFAIPAGHQLGVVRFRQGQWQELPLLSHDSAEGTITVETTEISRFAIATREPAP